jgi:hypothetical protein
MVLSTSPLVAVAEFMLRNHLIKKLVLISSNIESEDKGYFCFSNAIKLFVVTLQRNDG